jgi:hypothetical protein
MPCKPSICCRSPVGVIQRIDFCDKKGNPINYFVRPTCVNQFGRGYKQVACAMGSKLPPQRRV